MKLDYEYFGDIVCFDTAYKKEKKKDDWPFALFVGVNNHKQSIVFGAPLVYEDLRKFKCVCLTLLLRKFLIRNLKISP